MLIKEIQVFKDISNVRDDIFDPVNMLHIRKNSEFIIIRDIRDEKKAIKVYFENVYGVEFFNSGLSFPQIVSEIQSLNFSEKLKPVVKYISEPHSCYSPFRKINEKAKFNPQKKVTKATVKSLFHNKLIAFVYSHGYFTDDYRSTTEKNFRESFIDVEEFYFKEIFDDWFFEILFNHPNPEIKKVEQQDYYIIQLHNSWTSYSLFVQMNGKTNESKVSQ